MRYTAPLLCILLPLSAVICAAQNTRTFEFTTYGQYPVRAVEYTPVSKAAIADGATPASPIQIETHPLARTGPYSFHGENTITFRDTQLGTPVARVTLPTTSEKWLLIFVKNPRHKADPAGQLKYLIYPFDDSAKNLPKNRLIFLNISGKELDGLLEDKRVTFTAGESDSYRAQESLPINLWARNFDGDKLLPALIKTYRFDPNHRYLMIFFPPVLRGSADLDVRFLNEAVE